jgi:hypothetical protein
VSGDSWLEYAEYARSLDAVRAEEAARTAGMRQGVAEMTTHADDLEARLNGQGGMLTELAATLRLRRPKLTPIAPAAPVQPAPTAPAAEVSLQKSDPGTAPVPAVAPIEPAVALSQLAGAIDRGDAEALQAATRGEYPALLPKLSGPARGLLVYGIAALMVLALQGLAFSRTGSETNPIVVLFVIPLLGFAVGFLVLHVGGRTRVAQAAPEPPTRLGFVLCFLIGPLAGLVVLGLSLRSR